MSNAKTILSLHFSAGSDYENIVETLENKLQEIEKPLQKRIVSCAVELIQNNIIHNSGNEILVRAYESDNQITLNTYRKLNDANTITLQSKILDINNKNTIQLKELFKQNLNNESATQGTGNGLILCRLKSDSEIYTNSDGDTFEITLKFDKHGNTN